MRAPTNEQFAEYTVAVLARVAEASRIDSPGWNTWRIRAERMSEGWEGREPSEFTFTATLSSNGCGQTELPPAGEVWVLFLAGTESSEVLDALPLEYLQRYEVTLPEFP